MPTTDQDDGSTKPAHGVELTNDSLLNGENEEASVPVGRKDGGSQHRPKRRVARRKIRVELIKDRDERSGLPVVDEAEQAAQQAYEPQSPHPCGRPSPFTTRIHLWTLPEPITPSFVAAVREALSELEPMTVTEEEVRQGPACRRCGMICMATRRVL